MSFRKVGVLSICLLVLWTVGPKADAQDAGLSYGEEAAARLKSAGEVSPIGDTGLGESISLYNGSVNWRFVDVSIPSNVGPPVEFASIVRVAANGGNPVLIADTDIPHVTTLVPRNYVGGWPASTPDGYGSGGVRFRPLQYGQGFVLHVGGSSQPLQSRATDAKQLVPQMGGAFEYSTASGWVLQRKTATNGQLYLVGYSPNGLKYTFNVLERLPYSTVAHPHAWAPNGGGGYHIALLETEQMQLYESRIEDRFGNRVDYTWSGRRLTAITGVSQSESDRQILINYHPGDLPPYRVSSVVANGRTWTYSTSGVIFPDGSSRTVATNSATHPSLYQRNYAQSGDYWMDPLVTCARARRLFPNNRKTVQVSHPSGANVVYTFQFMRHGRTNMPFVCLQGDEQHNPSSQWSLLNPPYEDVWSLVERRVEGPGVPVAVRTYSYGFTGLEFGFKPGSNWLDPGEDEAGPLNTRKITVAREDGSTHLETYGRDWGVNDGQLLETELRSSSGEVLRRETYSYLTPDEVQSHPFSPRWGGTTVPRSDTFRDLNLPLRLTTVTQQGTTFNSRVDAYDQRARPELVQQWSSPGSSRSSTSKYFDHPQSWTLGQVERRLINGTVFDRTEFNSAALPWRIHANEKLRYTLTYRPNGTVATVTDGRSLTTRLDDWHRGVPRKIEYADLSARSAIVTNDGWVTGVTDENAFATTYGYDDMGRLARITHPTGDSVAWNATTMAFQQIPNIEYGIPAGHWRHTVSTGSARKITYYDGLWRPLLVREYDTANEAGTQRFQRYTYDHVGRVTFASYPASSSSPTSGTRTDYDPLGRVTRVRQDWEGLGQLTSTSEYLNDENGYFTRVTNPRNEVTDTWYQAFDQASYDTPRMIWHPEGIRTHITRDAFGKPTRLRRSDSTNLTGASLAINRDYTYNTHQELCRVVEPETGATLMGYDGAGNLSWSASGLPAGTACHATGTTSAIIARKATRSYDERNRAYELRFPDGVGDTVSEYTPDGLLESITAYNDGQVVATSYEYNRRRLLTHERMQSGAIDWSIARAYNANGHLRSLTIPGVAGMTVDYFPNGLGQPTQAGTFASGVRYHSNGAIEQFEYGNGIVRTLTQNVRGLPAISRDAYGSSALLQDEYFYDQNANVVAITDAATGQNQRGNRTMDYDGMDRLTRTTSLMFGTATYGYDVLDNLRSVRLTGGTAARDHTYEYDGDHRLTRVIGTTSGATLSSLSYDAQGNISNRDGQGYDFDFGNRLRSVSGVEAYNYDGHGRRVQSFRDGASIFSMYDQEGVLRRQRDEHSGRETAYVHLASKLIAQVHTPIELGVPTLDGPSSSHTGSFPVSWTNVPGASHFELEEQAPGQGWQIAYAGSSLATPIADKGNGVWNYRVRACNVSACGADSAPKTVTVTLPPANAPDLTVPETTGWMRYTVEWLQIDTATRYELQERSVPLHSPENPGAWSSLQNDGRLSRTIIGQPEGIWDYQVRACNVAGCSAYSSVGQVIRHTPPPTPTLTVPTQVARMRYTVEWTSSSKATHYELEERIEGGEWEVVQHTQATRFTRLGQSYGVWEYRVRGCNSLGCGAYSEVGAVSVSAGIAEESEPMAKLLLRLTSQDVLVSFSKGGLR